MKDGQVDLYELHRIGLIYIKKEALNQIMPTAVPTPQGFILVDKEVFEKLTELAESAQEKEEKEDA
ncbi:hypothetical protein L5B71_04375 [Avibacterium sp. 21-586]|uniref:hypothetical protein n=1 Tax=Avibacterium sp. 21-586 TaxID=2911534 RepID=UPI0022475688|nr:hypothetical protein [Avibacterium sp. 21-586]MCW9710118.1 hypothetical protein [Avibacterium sp. 21-586]